MLRTQFTLKTKKQLTHNVFELTYSCTELIREIPLPGQYVMFQLAPWLNRSYSLSDLNVEGGEFSLIIKRIAEGKWSPLLCDAEIWTAFSGMIPLGHFTLKNTDNSKCFIGTGTGFAPLYFQIRKTLENFPWEKVHFLFGVREAVDLFYETELNELAEKHPNFSYSLHLSQEDAPNTVRWYVTDWIVTENTQEFDEFYICGSPSMVKDARAKLETLGKQKEQIFWEQY